MKGFLLGTVLLAASPVDLTAEQEAWRVCLEVEQTLRAAPSEFRPPEDTIRSMVERCRETEF